MRADVWRIALDYPASVPVRLSWAVEILAVIGVLALFYTVSRLDAMRAARWMQRQLDRPWFEAHTQGWQ